MAREIAAVGIVPEAPPCSRIGDRFYIAGHPFAVTGYATREEFLDAVNQAGLEDDENFKAVPPGLHFLRVSTD